MIWCVTVGFVFGLSLLWPNFWILWSARDRVYSETSRLPEASLVLVLGCAPKLTSGRANTYFSARVQAAAELVRCGKANRVLVSGGPLRPSEQSLSATATEADCMKQALISLGVPSDMIDTDHLGLRTRFSVERVRMFSSCRRVVVVTQAFHAARAVYLAQRRGIRAHGFIAKSPKFWSKRHLKIELREVLSRSRAFWER
jgi:SanA protein